AMLMIVITLSFVVLRNLQKKSHDIHIKSGVISGLTTGIIHIIFSCVVCALSEGEGFITYWKTHEVINGISFNTVKIVGICLASLVPILLCSGKDFKGYLKYIISSSLVFVAVCVFEWLSVFIVFYISETANVDIIFPLNTYDSLFFAFIYFPMGAFLGTLISIIANAVLNISKKKKVC
ncbi:MAG: hypothetical protein II359_01340, partial [Clostridia bacterium]|nr:hypothetical protein [Clostridia bacterium]